MVVTLSELELTDDEFEKRRFQLSQNPRIADALEAAEEGKYNKQEEPVKLDKDETLELLKITEGILIKQQVQDELDNHNQPQTEAEQEEFFRK